MVQKKSKFQGIFTIHHSRVQGVEPPQNKDIHEAIIRKFGLDKNKLKGGQLTGKHYNLIRTGWGTHFVMVFNGHEMRWDLDEVCLQMGN